MYSVGEFAKLINKSVRTLQRWDALGILKSNRTTTDRRYYTELQLQQYKGLCLNESSYNIAYCRVSSKGQSNDLKNQKEFISQFALNSGIEIDDWMIDIGSGLNFKRKNFNQLMNLVEHGKIKTIIVAHRDRLVRFGYEWFEQFCVNHGVKILLINNDKLSPEQELVQDLISIIHVFSCRIYGLRKYKKTIKEDVDLC